jgi:hypothetical protein
MSNNGQSPPSPPAVSALAVADPQLAARARVALVDAAALAVELGVSRDWVYEHADELGALRLGNGPKARLRFDPIAARAALGCYGSERSQAPNVSAGAVSGQPAPRRSGKRAARSPQPGSILPIRPRRKAAAR